MTEQHRYAVRLAFETDGEYSESGIVVRHVKAPSQRVAVRTAFRRTQATLRKAFPDAKYRGIHLVDVDGVPQ